MAIPTSSRPRYRFTKLVSIMRDRSVSDFATKRSDPRFIVHAWADIRPVRGAEVEQASQMTNTATYSVGIRRPGISITRGDWLDVGGRRFDITDIVEDRGEERVLVLQCKTKATDVGEETLRG